MAAVSCSVLLPLPAAHPYSYLVPGDLTDRVTVGSRVVVPVRGGEMVGVVAEVGDSAAEGLKSVLLAPDAEPLVPPGLLALGDWVARYYAAPLGMTLKAMLPPALWGRSRLIATVGDPTLAAGGASKDVLEALERAGGRAPASALSRKLRRPVWETLQRLARAGAVTLDTEPASTGPATGSERVLVLTRRLPSLLERDKAFERAPRQRALYEATEALGGDAPVSHLTARLGFTTAILKALAERGLARIEDREHLRDPFSGVGATPPSTPTERQRAAVREIEGLPAGEAAVLFGVTGSGKTLVYLEWLRGVVAAGGGAIVLVPEIALTPQTIARVRGVFGDEVAVLHSALSDAERADAWRAVASGRRRVVVGARSAVFAPVGRLAAIVVDEEHDASYKHGESPRYQARDVALRRAKLEGARVVLGSATPSLEIWAAASRERICLIRLPERIGAPRLPPVTLVDLRTAPRVDTEGPVVWSVALDSALRECLDRTGQAMLLLNRRGFAHFLQCPDCGAVRECPRCSIALTVHRTPAGLRCHYCDHHEPIPEQCAQCGHATQRMRGIGTQQLEAWLGARFPGARLARMDADTTASKWSHRRLLDAFARREIDVLFGTQMIAKGLDFPGVTLVGVVDADTGLHLPDFRAAERTFQLIAQVAGRAGRGPEGGQVIVQTRSPDHYALQAAAGHDFPAFASRELDERVTPAYPPHVALTNVIVSGPVETNVARAAAEVAAWLQELIRTRAGGRIEVLGPAPAPLARIQNRWRWHVLLRSRDRNGLGRVVRYAARRAPKIVKSAEVRVICDRDPVALL